MSNSNEPTGYVPPPESAGLTGLGGLDPRELLKGGLNSIPKQSKWTPPEPAELAALLPKYEIEALIGHGGMGAVYKGRQPDLDRAVAIKLLPAELTVDGDFVERFKREAKMLAKLQHPGIVAVFETGQTSAGHLYFVMEFVDGTDLAQVIHGVGLQPVQALEIVTQICDALHYAHKHGVIHRDIKPANVLLNREGRAKLADFGLAKPEESGIGANLTAPQVVMGTPSYMAPEAKTGKSDERSDIFSLGVMLYEMLTGQTPAGVFPPASQRVQVDIRIDDVVLKAMQQQPERRYQQASEFKTDVDTIRVGPAPVVKKSRLPVGLGIAAVVSLGGFFIWGKMNGKPTVEPPATAATAKPAATSAEALVAARKQLAEARAHAKAGQPAEAIALCEKALAIAPSNTDLQGEAALIFADSAAPERGLALADGYVKTAEPAHPLFDRIAELRVKFGPKQKEYTAHLEAAAKAVAAKDDATELTALRAATAALPDGAEALRRLAENPLHIGKPVRGRAWTNELGMKFIPLPGRPNILISVWETRVKDFEAFVKETGYVSRPSKVRRVVNGDGFKPTSEQHDFWKDPGFAQTVDHPVVSIERGDTIVFCRWLTKGMQGKGQLVPGQQYRLPTDSEWSAAIGVEDGDDPLVASETKSFPKAMYSWGTAWPPPKGAENLHRFVNTETIEFTAPVGSFRPNPIGIYDIDGNVVEHCWDHWSPIRTGTTCRGAGFGTQGFRDRGGLRIMSEQRSAAPDTGFRCVLDLQSAETLPAAAKVEAAVDVFIQKLKPSDRVFNPQFIAFATLKDGISLKIDYFVGLLNDKELSLFANLPIVELWVCGERLETADALLSMPLKRLNVSLAPNTIIPTINKLNLEALALRSDRRWYIDGKIESKSLKSFAMEAGPGKTTLDLSGLAGAPLRHLMLLHFNSVDLTPLKNAPIETIDFEGWWQFEKPWPECLTWWPKLKMLSGSTMVRVGSLGPAIASGDDSKRAAYAEAWSIAKNAHPSDPNLVKDLDKRFADGQRLWSWVAGDRSAANGEPVVFGGHTYAFWKVRVTFAEADAIARRVGAHVVTINSAEELSFIQTLKSEESIMLGLKRNPSAKSEWQWVTGEPMTFEAWAPNQTSDKTDVVTANLNMKSKKLEWFSSSAEKTGYLLLEWDSPTPTGPKAGVQSTPPPAPAPPPKAASEGPTP